MEDEFKIVSGRRRKHRHKIDKKIKAGIIDDISEPAEDNLCHERHISMLEVIRDEIQSSCFWNEMKDSMHSFGIGRTFKFEEIISYGAGHVATNPIARYQFAFLLLFAQNFELTNHVYIYDPVFTVAERSIIKHFGFELIAENEECLRKITRPSVIFMMHCGKAMYNNVLKANWGMGLENIVIIGNSFSSYLDRFPVKRLKTEAPYLCDIIPHAKELPINNSFTHKDVFNDTAFITFPRSSLDSLGDEFWTREKADSVFEDDTEIITKSRIKTFRF